MYYFLKNKDFNLEEYDFEIDCIPRFTKKEQDVLRKDQGLFFKTLSSEFSRRFNALIEFWTKVDKMSFHISQIPETHCS